MSASTSKLGSCIDGQRCVVDIALHMRRGQQGDHLPSDVANDFAEHNHSVSSDISRDFAALADDHLRPGHITLKLAINLDLVLADDLHALACNSQIIFDHHFPAPIIHNAYPSLGTNISAHDQGNQSSKPAPFTTLIVENLWKSLGFNFGEARPRLWITRALNSHESTQRIQNETLHPSVLVPRHAPATSATVR